MNIGGRSFLNFYELIYNSGNKPSMLDKAKESGLIASETMAALDRIPLGGRLDFLNSYSNAFDKVAAKKYGNNFAGIFHKSGADKDIYSAVKSRKYDNRDVSELKKGYSSLAFDIKREALNAKIMICNFGNGRHEIKSPQGEAIALLDIKDGLNLAMKRKDGSSVTVSFSSLDNDDCNIVKTSADGIGEKLSRRGSLISQESVSGCEKYSLGENKSLIYEKSGLLDDDKQKIIAFKNGSSERQSLMYLDDEGNEVYDKLFKERDFTAKHEADELSSAADKAQSNEIKAASNTSSEKNSDSVKGIKDKKTAEFFKANPEYVKILEERYKNADPEVRKLYDKFKKDIKIADGYYKGTSHYHSLLNYIKLESQSDIAENGYIYYHEVGHMVDDFITIFGDASDNKTFLNAIKADFENAVANTIKELHIDGYPDLTREEAYTLLSAKLQGQDHGDYRGISDVFSGLSKGKVIGFYGHSQEYWQSRGSSGICSEAFAHMFEMFMGGNEREINNLKKMMPETYKAFMKIVKDENG